MEDNACLYTFLEARYEGALRCADYHVNLQKCLKEQLQKNRILAKAGCVDYLVASVVYEWSWSLYQSIYTGMKFVYNTTHLADLPPYATYESRDIMLQILFNHLNNSSGDPYQFDKFPQTVFP